MPQRHQGRKWLQHLKLAKQAIIYFQQEKLNMALVMIKRSLWIQSNHASLFFLYSLFLYEINEKKLSKLMEEKAIEMNPLCEIYELPDKKAILKIKSILDKSIGYEESLIGDGKRLVTNNWYHYTVMLHEQTDYQRVQQVYQRLFNKFPKLYTQKSHAFLGNYANMLYDLGKYEAALQKYQIQIRKDPNQMRFFSNCSMLYTILGNYQKAENYIKIALNGIPGRTSFLFNYANILAKTNRYNQSIQKIKQSITSQSADPILKVKLAITLVLSKNLQAYSIVQDNLNKAINIFKSTIQKNNIELTNCNKRILSMKNVVCLQIFSSLMLSILKLKQQKWQKMNEFLAYFSDYLIVGQATKMIINNKILMLIREKLKQQKVRQQQIKFLVQEQKKQFLNINNSNPQVENNLLPVQIAQKDKSIVIKQEQKYKQLIEETNLTSIMIENLKRLKAICYRSQIVRLTKWPDENKQFEDDDIFG